MVVHCVTDGLKLQCTSGTGWRNPLTQTTTLVAMVLEPVIMHTITFT